MRFFFGIILIFFSFSEISAQCNQNFDLGSDVEICLGESTVLDASNIYLTYQWNDNSNLQTLQINQSGTYYCTVSAIDESINLVANGDFEAGNNSFNTDYTFYAVADIFGPNASYGIVTNSNTWFNPFSLCTDHTSGTGNMMVLDGSSTNGGNDAIWCQNIIVNQNTDYNFSYWAQSVTGAPFANLRVEINGVVLGTSFAPGVVCQWEKTDYTWNSNLNTTAQICIYDNELSGNGNDFAIDDIALSPICLKSDTVVVSYSSPDTLSEIITLCEGDSFLINNIYENTNGLYYENILVNNCTAYKEINLMFKAIPSLSVRNDTTIISGSEIEFSVNSDLSNTSFEWYLFNDLVSTNQSFNLTLTETSTFSVVGENDICSQTGFVTVSVVDQSNDLLFPTAFSPNNDGINDVFRLVNTENIKEVELSIYNRWGERIHFGINENHAWSGNYKEVQQNQDVYIYYVKTKTINNVISTESGTVSLLR